jgi:glycosyltransferase involved in cell wall biosynthesis
MKIAFVNQAIDTILPPYQNSVGACTFGTAHSLAGFCDVVAYGHKMSNAEQDAIFDRNPRFHFLPATRKDRWLATVRRKYSRLVQTSSPDSSSPWQFPDFGRQVAIALQKEQCDVIHLQHCASYIPAIRARNPRSKIVLHLHAEWFSQNKPTRLQRWLRHVDLVTAVSHYITKKTKRDFPMIANRCETTYNGIDPREFARIRNYHTTRSAEKRIFYSGAVSPHKGLHVLLEAFKLVVERYPNVRLDISGPIDNYPFEETFDLKDQEEFGRLAHLYARGALPYLRAKLLSAQSSSDAYFSYLKRLIPQNIVGQVSFLGFISRSQLIDRYYSADVFAFTPIWNEGFGIPPVEAMAAGVPVVASRSGALVETVKDRQTGFLVEKNNPQQVADAILTLLENDSLRETMGKRAQEHVLNHFTWDRVAAHIYERYSALCHEQPASADNGDWRPRTGRAGEVRN